MNGKNDGRKRTRVPGPQKRLANSASYAFRAWVKDSTGKVSPGADVLLVGTKATQAASAAWITYAGSVSVSTTVTKLDGTPLAGAPIVLYAKAKNATTYAAIATVTLAPWDLTAKPPQTSSTSTSSFPIAFFMRSSRKALAKSGTPLSFLVLTSTSA